MFAWFKERRKKAAANRFLQEVPKILDQYGELLEKYPMAYLDETWLPVPKSNMKRILKFTWTTAVDEQMREAAKVGWTLLSMFQKNVGNIPLYPGVTEEPDAESISRLGRYLEFAKLAESERNSDYMEMQTFIKEQSSR